MYFAEYFKARAVANVGGYLYAIIEYIFRFQEQPILRYRWLVQTKLILRFIHYPVVTECQAKIQTVQHIKRITQL